MTTVPEQRNHKFNSGTIWPSNIFEDTRTSSTKNILKWRSPGRLLPTHPRYRTPQAIRLANYDPGFPVYSFLLKVAWGVFQRCVETTATLEDPGILVLCQLCQLSFSKFPIHLRSFTHQTVRDHALHGGGFPSISHGFPLWNHHFKRGHVTLPISISFWTRTAYC